MLNDDEKIIMEPESTEVAPFLDENKLKTDIILADNYEDLQHQLDIFNISQSKRSVLRTLKLNDLLDKVEDEAIHRFETRPELITNRELIDYMNSVSSLIEHSSNAANIEPDAGIKLVQQNTAVNINMNPGELDRDGKERVMDVVSKLLKQAKQISNQSVTELPALPNDDIIDMDTTAIEEDMDE